MASTTTRSLICAATAAAALFAKAGTSSAQTLTQAIEISPGWNAVYLEVDPVEAKPAALFDGTPVDTVARYFQGATKVQFLSDPAEEPWKKEGWGVWYAPGQEKSFLSSLHAIDGGQAYLVHATEAFSWQVEGEPLAPRRSWRTESFNFTGFSVDADSPPAFGDFFAGAEGAIGERIYRLVDGRWAKVLEPHATSMRPGEAFWIYCDGRTRYAGPLQVATPPGGRLDFGDGGDVVTVEIKNTSPVRQQVTLSSSAGTALPIWRGTKDPSTQSTTFTAPGGDEVLATLEPGETHAARLQLRRELMSEGAHSAVLELRGESGSVVRLPVSAERQ